MKKVWQIFEQHPAAIIVYLLYAIFAQLVITAKWRYTAALAHIDSGERLAWGEGVMYGIIFLFFIAIIFVTVTLIFSFYNKDQKKFYYWLLFAIVAPIIIWFLI
jgi:hypothetical protein